MTVPLALYDHARAALLSSGFDATAQTKIALFVGTAKVVNASIMLGFEMQPDIGIAYPFVHGQYFRESEFASLLARVTHWAPGPLVYLEAAVVTAPIWLEWSRVCAGAWPVANARTLYSALALGHALLSRVRLTPVIAEEADRLDPFLVALRRIEQESGRMIQAQIRLLKDGGGTLDAREREKIVEDRQGSVDGALSRFLGWLAGDPVDPLTVPQPLPMIMESITAWPFTSPGEPFMRILHGVPPNGWASARNA